GGGDGGGLGRGGGMHEQRVERGRRYARDALAPCPLIIEIGPAHRVPEISVHRLSPGPRVLAERALAGLVLGLATAGCDRLLEPEQQAVEIDRHDGGGVDRGQGVWVGEQAWAEVTTGLGRREA